MTPGAQAQNTGSRTAAVAAPSHFDLPAEPLAEALKAFGNLNELSVLVPSHLVDGRDSAPVHGDYAPREALRLLLLGTGLQADFTDVDEAVIVPLPTLAGTPPASSVAAPALIAATAIDGVLRDGDNRAYAALVQTRVTEALCASAQTRPGAYRLVAQLLIDNAGAVAASKVVGSTGLPARDVAIGQALRALVFDSAPPAALPQPVTLLLRPHGNGVDTDCAQFDSAARH